MSEFLKNVGDRIRTIRKHRGLTQESLAEKTGLQNTYISDVERGDRNISLETLEKIVQALEVEAVDVFQFSQQSDKKQQMIQTLKELLSTKNTQEIKAIIKIVNEIFSSFGSKDIKKEG
ncbi:helix-turn-helix domain-containing protein [Brevibacillus invocatus]|uniref:helix-turn-helix domain-containing protein n=1 Tax=Brevibacillus invocatus TaxID=173959 RepID=UPI00203AE854|nr:helix-turn-helix domain-containing protein [Brevibacillus invocatus]